MAIVISFIFTLALISLLLSKIATKLFRLVRKLIGETDNPSCSQSRSGLPDSVRTRKATNQEEERSDHTMNAQYTTESIRNTWAKLSPALKVVMVIIGLMIGFLGTLTFLGIGLVTMAPIAVRIAVRIMPLLVLFMVGYFFVRVLIKPSSQIEKRGHGE